MWKKNHPSATRWPVAVASECGERRLRGETALGPCQHRRAHLVGIGELQWGWCGGHVRAARAAALVHHVPHLHLHHVVCAQRSHEHKQTCKSEVDTLRHGTKVQCLGFWHIKTRYKSTVFGLLITVLSQITRINKESPPKKSTRNESSCKQSVCATGISVEATGIFGKKIRTHSHIALATSTLIRNNKLF